MWPCDGVMTQISWIISNGYIANFFYDPWISNLSLSRWHTFINIEIGEFMRILDLLHIGRCGWRYDYVA